MQGLGQDRRKRGKCLPLSGDKKDPPQRGWAGQFNEGGSNGEEPILVVRLTVGRCLVCVKTFGRAVRARHLPGGFCAASFAYGPLSVQCPVRPGNHPVAAPGRPV